MARTRIIYIGEDGNGTYYYPRRGEKLTVIPGEKLPIISIEQFDGVMPETPYTVVGYQVDSAFADEIFKVARTGDPDRINVMLKKLPDPSLLEKSLE